MFKLLTKFHLFFLISFTLIYSSLNAELLRPENDASLNHIHVLFEWDQEPETNYYEIQISENSQFSGLIINVDSNTLIYIEKDVLDWNSTYHWRIRSIYNNGESGSWINTYTFSTGSPLSETNTTLSSPNQIQDGVTVFGAFFNYFSAAVDKTGKEIWNSGSENIVYYSTNKHGDVFGCTLVSGAENNLPGMEFTFEGEMIWEEPNDEFLHHDMIQLPNGNYLGIVETNSIGPIPVGDWTPLFQGLGFQADGVTIEFPWIGDKLVEWDKNTKEVVWSWSVFDHYNMMDFDQYGGTWNQAYQDFHYDWTHVNAVIFDEAESALYISTRHLSRITKINYPSGNIDWNLGHAMASGDVSLGNEIGFSFQHSIQKLENGNILTFDNGNLAPEFRGTNNPVSRAIEISIDGNNAELVWSYELPNELFGFASGNTQKLENDNVLITTVGGGGRSLEVNSNGDIVWEAHYNLSLPSGAVYRAHRIPGLFPGAFSVLVNDLYEMEGGNGIYLPPGSSDISFTIHNVSEYVLLLSFSLSDQADWFGSQIGEIELSPNSFETISFTGNVIEISNGNPITLIVTPAHHSEKEKTIVVEGFTNPLSTGAELIPSAFELFSAFPNPFNPTTAIRFYMGVETGHAVSLLQIFDITGRLVETLIDGRIEWGQHEIIWNAQNVASGIYFIKLSNKSNTQTQKVIYLR